MIGVQVCVVWLHPRPKIDALKRHWQDEDIVAKIVVKCRDVVEVPPGQILYTAHTHVDIHRYDSTHVIKDKCCPCKVLWYTQWTWPGFQKQSTVVCNRHTDYPVGQSVIHLPSKSVAASCGGKNTYHVYSSGFCATDGMEDLHPGRHLAFSKAVLPSQLQLEWPWWKRKAVLLRTSGSPLTGE